MCIIKATKYTGCPVSHSTFVVVTQHENAIYCGNLEIVEEIEQRQCAKCARMMVNENRREGMRNGSGERREVADSRE